MLKQLSKTGLLLGLCAGTAITLGCGHHEHTYVSGGVVVGGPAYDDGGGAVVVDNGPPPAQYEVEPPAPGPDYIWIGGYYDWYGGHYVWHRGGWRRPPHPGARWEAPHYVRGADGHSHPVGGRWR